MPATIEVFVVVGAIDLPYPPPIIASVTVRPMASVQAALATAQATITQPVYPQFPDMQGLVLELVRDVQGNVCIFDSASSAQSFLISYGEEWRKTVKAHAIVGVTATTT